MEKQENFCKRQAQKICRLFPVAILLFLFLSFYIFVHRIELKNNYG